MKISYKYILLALSLFAVMAIAPDAAAQTTPGTGISSASAFANPATGSGLVGGLQQVLQYVFIFLKFLAVIAAGYGSYQMWKGDISSGVWAYVAALALFFSPAMIDLAQNIGAKASNTNAAANTTIQITP